MSKEKNANLVDYARMDWLEGVTDILKEPSELDVLYDEGLAFWFAVDHKNAKMLNALLTYYKEHKLKTDLNSTEYQNNLDALYQVMDIIEEECEITTEVKEIIGDYLPTGRQQKLLDDLDQEIVRMRLKGNLVDFDTDSSSGYSDHEHDSEHSEEEHFPIPECTYNLRDVVLGDGNNVVSDSHQ